MRKALLWTVVIGIAAAIFMFSHQTIEVSMQTSDSLTHTVLEKVSPSYRSMSEQQQRSVLDTVKVLVRKTAHYTEFLLLGASVYLLCREYALHRCKLTAACCGIGYAFSDELHQLFVSGRSSTLLDVMIDSAGVLSGVLAAALLISLYLRRRKS